MGKEVSRWGHRNYRQTKKWLSIDFGRILIYKNASDMYVLLLCVLLLLLHRIAVLLFTFIPILCYNLCHCFPVIFYIVNQC